MSPTVVLASVVEMVAVVVSFGVPKTVGVPLSVATAQPFSRNAPVVETWIVSVLAVTALLDPPK